MAGAISGVNTFYMFLILLTRGIGAGLRTVFTSRPGVQSDEGNPAVGKIIVIV